MSKQVNGLPFKSPAMDTVYPFGSLALKSKASLPRHQPASPHRSHVTCPVISGGKGVGVGDGVFVGVNVGEGDGVFVGVEVGVSVDVGVNVGVKRSVGVCVGVKVVDGAGVTVSTDVGGGAL